MLPESQTNGWICREDEEKAALLAIEAEKENLKEEEIEAPEKKVTLEDLWGVLTPFTGGGEGGVGGVWLSDPTLGSQVPSQLSLRQSLGRCVLARVDGIIVESVQDQCKISSKSV
jgi:hypothetical protein